MRQPEQKRSTKPWLRERVGRSAQRVRRQNLARPRGRLRAPCAKPRVPHARRRARPARARRRQNGQPPVRRRQRKPPRARPPRRRYGNPPRARRRPASRRWRRSLWQLLHLSRLLPRPSRQGRQCPWPSRSGQPSPHRQAWEAAAWHRDRQRLWEAARPLRQRHVRQRREPRARARSLTVPLGRATTTICRRLRGRAGL